MRRPFRTKEPDDDFWISRGRSFSSGQVFENVSAGTQINILINNPDGSGRKIFLNPQIFRTEGSAFIRKRFNVDYSGGSPVDNGVTNKVSSDDFNSDMQVLKNVSSVSGGQTFPIKVIGSGNSVSTSTSGAQGIETENIVDQGDNLYLALENRTGAAQDMSIGVDWTEKIKKE